MKTHKSIISALLIFVAGVFLTACNDDDVESMKWRPGSGLHIIGADVAEVVDADANDESEAYYVDGFTVKETYEWRLNNAVVQPERGGEFVTLSFTVPGTYTLTVTNGRYTGTKTITVE